MVVKYVVVVCLDCSTVSDLSQFFEEYWIVLL